MDSQAVESLLIGNNLSFVLEEDRDFKSTDFKILNSQKESYWMECFKIKLNGKIQIFYHTSLFVPLDFILKKVEDKEFLIIFSKLCEDFIKIKKNDFLSIKNVLVDLNYVYLDERQKEIKWIYLPVNLHEYLSVTVLEEQFKAEIKKVLKYRIEEKRSVVATHINEFLQKDPDIEQVTAYLKTIHFEHKKEKSKQAKRLRLKSLDSANPLELVDTENEYILGRKSASVNGVIQFNKRIGRVHCVIKKENAGYSITDLSSRNGTYKNDERLSPQKPYSINHGDHIRLADSEFVVLIEEGCV